MVHCVAMKPEQNSDENKPFQFEKVLDELSTLVQTMEQGNISLEDSLKHFERGIKLTGECQKALQSAEQKVQILTDKNGQESLEPFEPE